MELLNQIQSIWSNRLRRWSFSTKLKLNIESASEQELELLEQICIRDRSNFEAGVSESNWICMRESASPLELLDQTGIRDRIRSGTGPSESNCDIDERISFTVGASGRNWNDMLNLLRCWSIWLNLILYGIIGATGWACEPTWYYWAQSIHLWSFWIKLQFEEEYGVVFMLVTIDPTGR